MDSQPTQSPIIPTPTPPSPPPPVPPVIPPRPPIIPQPPKKKSLAWLIILIILLLLASTGILAYQYYQLKTQTVNPASSPPLAPSLMPIPSQDPTADWKTYTDSQYKYSIKYPSSMVLEQITDDPFYPSYVIFKNEANQFNIRATESTVLATTETIRSQTEGHVVTELIKNETMQIGNVTARLLEYSAEDKNNNRSTLIIPSGKNVIVINAPSEMFDLILSTFKFLD